VSAERQAQKAARYNRDFGAQHGSGPDTHFHDSAGNRTAVDWEWMSYEWSEAEPPPIFACETTFEYLGQRWPSHPSRIVLVVSPDVGLGVGLGRRHARGLLGRLHLDDRELGDALRRYGFLVGCPLRTAAEESEMRLLKVRLLVLHGVDPGWQPVLRRERPKYERRP
jgi:hypothetical protein